jgi:hypothetical protein
MGGVMRGDFGTTVTGGGINDELLRAITDPAIAAEGPTHPEALRSRPKPAS